MKQMMQGVVLHGTGKKAILEGYSSAGKTGTAQKIDPKTHTYSRTQYIASFAGFAPVNTPVVTICVILDSPVGGHHGGEVGAPVFQRIAQQTLEYLHTTHDVDLPANRQLLLAAKQAKPQDLEEGSPDRLGDTLEVADGGDPLAPPPAPQTKPTPEVASSGVVPAAMRERDAIPAPAPDQTSAGANPPPVCPGRRSCFRHGGSRRRARWHRGALIPGENRTPRHRNGGGKQPRSRRYRQRSCS